VYKLDTHLSPPYFKTYPEFIQSDWKRGHNKQAVVVIDPIVAQQDMPDGSWTSFFTPKNFNTSMAIVAFFLLGFFSIYLRRRAGLPLGGLDEYVRRAMGSRS
jgi:hypothetical protein